MSNEMWFKDYLEKFKDDVEFITEEVIIEFTEKIVDRMEKLNLSRTELAKKLGVSKAFITKILNGNPNLTVKTMVSIAKALECKLDIELCPEGFETRKKFENFVKEDFRTDFELKICGEIYASAA
ncbi:MAG: helix-turn-helix transcriptional regulator [candidate division WOR-3 bacterium]